MWCLFDDWIQAEAESWTVVGLPAGLALLILHDSVNWLTVCGLVLPEQQTHRLRLQLWGRRVPPLSFHLRPLQALAQSEAAAQLPASPRQHEAGGKTSRDVMLSSRCSGSETAVIQGVFVFPTRSAPMSSRSFLRVAAESCSAPSVSLHKHANTTHTNWCHKVLYDVLCVSGRGSQRSGPAAGHLDCPGNYTNIHYANITI